MMRFALNSSVGGLSTTRVRPFPKPARDYDQGDGLAPEPHLSRQRVSRFGLNRDTSDSTYWTH